MKIWTGNEDCEPVTWEDCKLVEKKVPFKVPKITCEDAGQIPYIGNSSCKYTILPLDGTCLIEN